MKFHPLLVGEEHIITAVDLLSIQSSLRQIGREPDCRESERLGDVYARHGLTIAERATVWKNLCLVREVMETRSIWHKTDWKWSARWAEEIRQAAEAAERQEHKEE